MYKEEFADGTDAFTESEAFLHSQESNSLRIINKTKSDGFVSASLRQTFDFKENFLLRGSFVFVPQLTAEGQKEKPMGLDISFGNRYKDLVSVILGDGFWDAYSIKTAGEYKLVDEDTESATKATINRRKHSDYSLSHDGASENYFEVRFSLSQKVSDRMWCKLYVDSTPPDPDHTDIDPVFKRSLPMGQLQTGVTRIRIKLWKTGEVLIGELEVAELPPSGENF